MLTKSIFPVIQYEQRSLHTTVAPKRRSLLKYHAFPATTWSVVLNNTTSLTAEHASSPHCASLEIWNNIFRYNSLFFGEGNFSFARSIATMQPCRPKNMFATTFESSVDWDDDTRRCAANLRAMGVFVMGNVDATKLGDLFDPYFFDIIIFQFPNTGDRNGIRGRNSNFVLIKKFLKSAKACIRPNGWVIISAVNSPYYEGCFQFSEAAEDAGFNLQGPFPFEPSDFPGYEHTNTNNDESAIEGKTNFGSWIFRPVGKEKGK